MLVGDVRWATTGCGSSWKLSGGRAWSSGPTNRSKNRHVRRAMRRSAMASAADSWRPADSGARHAHPPRDRRGQQPEAHERHGQRDGGRLQDEDESASDGRDRHGAGHQPVEAGQVEVQAALRLRGGGPFEQVAARDEQARQRPTDRVRHERRLVGEERETQPDVGGGIGDVGRDSPQVAPLRDATPPRQQSGQDGQRGRNDDGRQHERGPHAGRHATGPSRPRGRLPA